MTAAASATSRTARLGLRATPEQETVLRRAAEVAHESLTHFILDSACVAAERALLDQRLFMVSGSQYQALLDLLEQPDQTNEGLRDMFSRKAPLGCKVSLRGPEPLRPQHQLEGFDCGKPALTDWLLRHARQVQGCGSAKTFVVADDDRVAGYFSLTAGQIGKPEAQEHIRKRMGQYPLPVVIPARLAVSQSDQGRGIGFGLLQDAIQRAMLIAGQAGIRAMLTHPIDEEAARFYTRFGLIASPLRAPQLLLLLKDARRRVRCAMGIESLSNFSPPARQRWELIPATIRQRPLANVWCRRRRQEVTITNFSVVDPDLLRSLNLLMRPPCRRTRFHAVGKVVGVRH